MKYLTPGMVTAVKQSEPPPNRNVYGYGSKIPLAWELEIDGRWHRLYMVCYGNSGSPYVVVKGEDFYLGDFDPRNWQGPLRKSARRPRRRR